MIRKRLNEVDDFLDGLQGGFVLFGIAERKIGRQNFRRCFSDGAKLEQIDEVDVAEPIGTLVLGQVRVEPSKIKRQ